MTKAIVGLGVVFVAMLAIAACGGATVKEVMPAPDDGSEYTASELCSLVIDAGYDVKGSIVSTIPASAFEPVIEGSPQLIRGALAGYLGDGLTMRITFDDFCGLTGRN